jgi:cyclase
LYGIRHRKKKKKTLHDFGDFSGTIQFAVNFFEKFLNFLKPQIKNCFLPITIGGGIEKIEDVDYLFDIGADRVALNEVLWSNPKLVEKISYKYGSQAVVASIDIKFSDGKYFAYDWRTKKIRNQILPDILAAESNLIGEILLQSVDRDGSVQGFDGLVLQNLNKALVKFVPLNIGSGFGKWDHYSDVLKLPEVDCVSVQNVHHMSAIAIQGLKAHCRNLGLPIR